MQSARRLLLVASLLAAAGGALAQNTARPSEVLTLHGPALQASHVLTADDLAALPPELLGEFRQSRGAPGAEVGSTVRGVRLARLVERLGLTPPARADWKNLLVTVTATDGYRAHFTWVELVNTPAGEGVLLVFERDGQRLDTREGRIALYSTGDFRLGARHVRNALRVEVRPAPF